MTNYVFFSGVGGQGICIMTIKSDTDNEGHEADNCQLLFSKEKDQVQGFIGMGIPGTTD